MAIAFDAVSFVTSSGTSATASHICSGSNRILFAFVKSYKAAPADVVTGVTYNGVAMTQITKIAQSTSVQFYLYYLVAPATGANNIVATASASTIELDILGISYVNASQTGVPDAYNSGNASTTNTVSVTTVADNSWLVGYFCSDNGSTVSAGASTTLRDQRTFAGITVDSNGAKTPPGSYSLQATGSTLISGIVASFKPSTDNETTVIISPNANPESTSVDGQTYRGTTGVNESFATIRAGAGTNEWQSDSATTMEVRLDSSTTSNQYTMLGRAFVLFDTSSIPTNAVISSAIIALYGNGKLGNLGTTGFTTEVCAASPASNTAIAYTDHTNISRTSFASKTYANVTNSVYNLFTLDANGIANITKGGISKFSLQSGWDYNNSFGGTWASGAATLLRYETSDTAVSNAKPKLIVTYTVSTGRNLALLGVGQ